MNSNAPGEQLSQEPQSERGETGSRDTGSDKPGGGPADRTEGRVDDKSLQSQGGSGEGDFGGTGTHPPEDTGAAVPPYEGRQTSAKPIGREEGAEGGVKPVESSQYKSAPPGSTAGGSTGSPGDEQPADEQPETDRGYDSTGPAHTPGTGRGENKR
ncbi:hypothetical protein [Mycobacterium sp.]|uniref:hypothetical protein n=1 Tax=Mycobacterium sp. TaxID=1785 RepID=UPI003D0F7F7D